ncbi:MAG: flippase [Methanobacterium sp.]|jgi:O-antigen/teichoic acid export membrane protein|nr:flippase [Methanobacterium sp.]
MKFIKHIITTFLTTVLIFILSIVSSVIIARALGPEGQGIYTLVMLLPSLILILTNLGISRSVIYHLSKGDLPGDVLTGNFLIAAFILMAASVLIGYGLILFGADEIFPNVPHYLLLMGLVIIPLQLLFSQFYSGILYGLQKINTNNLFNLIQSIFLVIFIFLLVLVFKEDISGALTATIISLFITDILMTLWIIRNVPISFKFRKDIQKSIFSFGIKVHLTNVMYFFRSRVDVFILNFFLNPQAVGFYGIAYGTAETIWMLSQSAGNVLSPKISSMSSEEQKKYLTPIITRNIFFISLMGAVALFLMGYWLIGFLYSESYLPSVEPMKILLIGVVAISAERILMSDIIARGKPIISTYLTAITVVLNIGLNVLLIPWIGILGVAWASSIAYSINLILTLAVYCRISGNSGWDVIIIKKEDIKLYKNFIKSLKTRFIP